MSAPACTMVDDPRGEDGAGLGSVLERPTVCTRCGRRGTRPVRTLNTSGEEWAETVERWNRAPERTCEGRAVVVARETAYREAAAERYFGLPPGYRVRPGPDRLAEEAEARRLHRRTAR